MTRWEIDGTRARVLSAPRAPWQASDSDAADDRWYELPAPAAPRAPVYVEPTVEQLRDAPVLCEVNLVRARLGRDPYPFDLSEAETERRRGKIYEEHSSYPVTIVLPLCGCCGAVAARCPCPWQRTLPVDVQPTEGRAPCACGRAEHTRAA